MSQVVWNGQIGQLRLHEKKLAYNVGCNQSLLTINYHRFDYFVQTFAFCFLNIGQVQLCYGPTHD